MPHPGTGQLPLGCDPPITPGLPRVSRRGSRAAAAQIACHAPVTEALKRGLFLLGNAARTQPHPKAVTPRDKPSAHKRPYRRLRVANGLTDAAGKETQIGLIWCPRNMLARFNEDIPLGAALCLNIGVPTHIATLANLRIIRSSCSGHEHLFCNKHEPR